MTQYAKIYSDKTLNVSIQDTNSDQAYQEGESLKVCINNKCTQGQNALGKLKKYGLEEIKTNCPIQELNDYLKLYQEITHMPGRMPTRSTLAGVAGLIFLPIALTVMASGAGKSRLAHPLEENLLADVKKLQKRLPRIHCDKTDYDQKMTELANLSTPHLKVNKGIDELKKKINASYCAHLCTTLFSDAKYGQIQDLAQKISDLEQTAHAAGITLPEKFTERLTRLALDQSQIYFLDKMERQMDSTNGLFKADNASYDYREFSRRLKETKINPSILGYTDINAYHQDVLADTKQALLDLLGKTLKTSVSDDLKREIEEFRSFLETEE